jgi:hypothetical protein
LKPHHRSHPIITTHPLPLLTLVLSAKISSRIFWQFQNKDSWLVGYSETKYDQATQGRHYCIKVENDVLIHFHFKNTEGEVSRSGTLNVQDQTPQVSAVFDSDSMGVDAYCVNP